jgi:hypothetical protein
MTKPPSLVVISDTPEVTKVIQEKRKKPRIHLASEQFRIDLTGKVFSVVDLSTDGMAFRILDKEDFAMLPVAVRVTGVLNLRGEKYPVAIQVRHLGAQLVGCQFVDLSDEARTALEKFLDPSELGRELRPMPSADGRMIWYHGPGGTDLLLARSLDGSYSRFTLFVLRSYIQWEEELGVTTGRASPSKDRRDQQTEEWGVVQFETMLLEPDAQAQHDKLSIAKELILSSNLPQDLKKWCVRQLSVSLPQ